MGLPENIDALLVRYDITAEALARIAGVSPSSVSRWRQGSMIRNEPLQKICDYFGLERDDLLSTAAGLAAKEHGTRTLPHGARRMTSGGAAWLPVRRLGTVHAGDPTDEDEDDATVMVPEDVALAHPDGFVLRVEGDCMDRRIPEGYDVVVDPTREPAQGSVVVVELEGGRAVMRRWLRGGQTLVLAADSHAEHDDIVLRWDDGPVRVLGVVVWSQAEVRG